MTIRELKRTLAHYNDDEHIGVAVFGPDKVSPVALGEVSGVSVCSLCDETNLVVVVTEFADTETRDAVQSPSIDVTPRR